MLTLVSLALAVPLVLEDPTRGGGGVGADVATGVDLDADGLRDIYAASVDGFTFWGIPARDAPTVLRSEAVERMTLTRFASLGTYDWGGDVGLIYQPSFAQSEYLDGVGSGWRTPVIDVLLAGSEEGARVADARTIDGVQLLASRYVYAPGSRAAGAKVRLYDTATGGTGCMTGTERFGEEILLVDDFPRASEGRLLVMSYDTTTGKTIVAWWELSSLPGYTECSTVAATNLGDATSVPLPVVPLQVVASGVRGGVGAWIAVLDADGLVHVVPLNVDGYRGTTVTPLGDAYTLGAPAAVSGTVLLAADVTGDDANEIILADPSLGVVYAFGAVADGTGAATFAAEPVLSWTGTFADAFGTSIAALPDRDGDGKAELVVGVPRADGGAGRVEVYFSGPWAEALDRDADGSPDSEDCFPDDPDLYPGAAAYYDNDGDGQGGSGTAERLDCGRPTDGLVADGRDCDDTDPAVYDGAQVWADMDGDGQGDSDAPFTLDCAAGARPYATDARDCDDADPTVFQGAVEACDGVDDDCNGLVDDGVTRVLFVDADGDGHGAGNPVSACEGAGVSAIGGDCDDSDASVNPDAEEVVGDGLDNDCANGDVEVSWGRGSLGCVSADGSAGILATVLAYVALAGRRRRSAGGNP